MLRPYKNLRFHFFKLLIPCLLLFCAQRSIAQEHLPALPTQEEDSLTQRVVEVGRVLIVGNKKTKRYVIEQEMELRSGDVIPFQQLNDLLAMEQQRINNTRLFTSVEVTPLPHSPRYYDILVEVRERWYIIPSPIFKLADRNLNDWWTNQNRDFSRVNVGLKFTHYNFRGRNEKLSALAQFGFTQSFQVSYYKPVIDKTKKNGAGISAYYAEYDNLPLRTLNHKRIFISAEEPIQNRWGAAFTFTRRASFYNTHAASLSFFGSWTADTIQFRNPEYIPSGNGNTNRAFKLSYDFRRDLRDVVGYPLSGFLLLGSIDKTGLGFFNDWNIFSASFSYHQFSPLPLKRFYLSNMLSGRLSTPENQPYMQVTGLGYGGNYVRGYELYVIEGQHYLLNRSELKFELFNQSFNLGNLMPIEEFRVIPIALYPKVYFDAAYVSSLAAYPGNNLLVDKIIWGAGLGLDLVSFYDFVLRLEVSRNSLEETGFFLHFRTGF